MSLYHHGKVDVVYLAENLMGRKISVYQLLRREIRDININPETGAARDSYFLWRPKTLKKDRSGWVVGIRWLQEGKYCGPEYDSEEWGGPVYRVEPGGIRVYRTVPALQVCFWPTTRSFNVPILRNREGAGWSRIGGIPESPGIRPLPDLGFYSKDFKEESS